MKSIYITTPIYYINDKPHIGHAYTTIAGDILARYHRMIGNSVTYVTGTDENSQKNLEAAQKAGVADMMTYLDSMSALWQDTWKKLDISHDDFIRTTQDRHHTAVAKFWGLVKEKGDIYKGNYEGWYCVGCEAFYLESDLVEGNCPTHKKPAQKIVEENYFFRLTAYRDALLAHIEAHPDFVQPVSRRNEIINYIKDNMIDVSISRVNASVGIPVPDDADHKIYVWFDALINYLSVVGFGSDEKKFNENWPAHLHLVGKDILKFHCALWPAMLLSAGLELPAHVFAHGHFTIDGEKMSKSLGNVVNPVEVMEKYGNDALRFHVMREIRFGEDGDFSLTRLEQRYVSELSNELGNLMYRVLSMSEKYCDGKIPAAGSIVIPLDTGAYMAAFEKFELHQALDVVWNTVRACNKLIDDYKPWELAKTDSFKVREVMYALLDALARVAHTLSPFCPVTAEKILVQLGLSLEEVAATPFEERIAANKLPEGTALMKGDVLFPRLS